MNETFDTVFAPSSAVGGAIAVIRVSGANARAVADAVLSRRITDRPNMLRHAKLKDGDAVIDECMAVFFRAPDSYTGEDMLELHCHGGIRTVRSTLALLSKSGAVPASAGEFTKRAFLNGKMDLSQAEAVMDVINAQTESGLKAAVEQLGGSVGRRVHAVEELLLNARAAIEAAIDYPDEAEADAYEALPQQLDAAKHELDALIKDGRSGRVLREGLKLVILGRPNVGKSSLLNALLGEDRAIVTAAAGTTRDVLDEPAAIDGIPVRLIDTAGMRDASDEAERIGVERARRASQTADVVLLVLDGSEPETDPDRALLNETEDRKRIVIANKSDLGVRVKADCAISCKTGEGIDDLKRRVASLALPDGQPSGCITNERHLNALERALEAVLHAGAQTEPDCIATDLKEALHQLGSITGTDTDAEVIDRIFANFCVGK